MQNDNHWSGKYIERKKNKERKEEEEREQAGNAGNVDANANRSVDDREASIPGSPRIPAKVKGDLYRLRVEGDCGTKYPGASMQLPYPQIKEK